MAGIVIALVFITGFILALVGAWELLPAKTQQQIINLIANWTRAAVLAAQPVLATLEADLLPIVKAFTAAFNAYGGPIAKAIQTPTRASDQSGAHNIGERPHLHRRP